MIVTLVLLLVGERLEMGELVGQARLVARDEEATVHDVGELIAFVRRATDGGGPRDGGPEPSPPARAGCWGGRPPRALSVEAARLG